MRWLAVPLCIRTVLYIHTVKLGTGGTLNDTLGFFRVLGMAGHWIIKPKYNCWLSLVWLSVGACLFVLICFFGISELVRYGYQLTRKASFEIIQLLAEIWQYRCILFDQHIIRKFRKGLSK